MKVIEGGFGKKACTNLSSDLREMADAVDRGEIFDFVSAFIRAEEFQFMCSASPMQSIVLASLLQRVSVDRMIVNG